MSENEIMQLAILFLLLLMGGTGRLNEMKPLIESLDKDAAGIIKQAEEFGGVLEAVRSLSGGAHPSPQPEFKEAAFAPYSAPSGGYPLAPVANIADEGIKSALSRYIALGA